MSQRRTISSIKPKAAQEGKAVDVGKDTVCVNLNGN